MEVSTASSTGRAQIKLNRITRKQRLIINECDARCHKEIETESRVRFVVLS